MKRALLMALMTFCLSARAWGLSAVYSLNQESCWASKDYPAKVAHFSTHGASTINSSLLFHAKSLLEGYLHQHYQSSLSQHWPEETDFFLYCSSESSHLVWNSRAYSQDGNQQYKVCSWFQLNGANLELQDVSLAENSGLCFGYIAHQLVVKLLENVSIEKFLADLAQNFPETFYLIESYQDLGRELVQLVFSRDVLIQLDRVLATLEEHPYVLRVENEAIYRPVGEGLHLFQQE